MNIPAIQHKELDTFTAIQVFSIILFFTINRFHCNWNPRLFIFALSAEPYTWYVISSFVANIGSTFKQYWQGLVWIRSYRYTSDSGVPVEPVSSFEVAAHSREIPGSAAVLSANHCLLTPSVRVTPQATDCVGSSCTNKCVRVRVAVLFQLVRTLWSPLAFPARTLSAFQTNWISVSHSESMAF